MEKTYIEPDNGIAKFRAESKAHERVRRRIATQAANMIIARLPAGRVNELVDAELKLAELQSWLTKTVAQAAHDAFTQEL